MLTDTLTLKENREIDKEGDKSTTELSVEPGINMTRLLHTLMAWTID